LGKGTTFKKKGGLAKGATFHQTGKAPTIRGIAVVSASWRAKFRAPLKSLVHHSTIVLRGLSRVLDLALIIQRHQPLGQKMRVFPFPSGGTFQG